MFWCCTASHAHHRESNNYLLRSAWDRMTVSALPTLLAGDFNCDVTALPAWDHFQAKGYLTAQQAAHRFLGLQLEPTCRDATSFDSFLLPPVLQGLLRHAQVLRHAHLFDSHHPLRLIFTRPCEAPLVRRWCLPRTWQDFLVDGTFLANCYSQHAHRVDAAIQGVAQQSDVDRAFTTWADAVESAVDDALRAQHRQDPVTWSQPCLPRSHRGRCKPPKFVHRQGPLLPKPGRSGDFMPDVECTSVRLRMKVRQCRRVQTFLSLSRMGCHCQGQRLRPSVCAVGVVLGMRHRLSC